MEKINGPTNWDDYLGKNILFLNAACFGYGKLVAVNPEDIVIQMRDKEFDFVKNISYLIQVLEGEEDIEDVIKLFRETKKAMSEQQQEEEFIIRAKKFAAELNLLTKKYRIYVDTEDEIATIYDIPEKDESKNGHQYFLGNIREPYTDMPWDTKSAPIVFDTE